MAQLLLLFLIIRIFTTVLIFFKKKGGGGEGRCKNSWPVGGIATLRQHSIMLISVNLAQGPIMLATIYAESRILKLSNIYGFLAAWNGHQDTLFSTEWLFIPASISHIFPWPYTEATTAHAWINHPIHSICAGRQLLLYHMSKYSD